MSIRIYKQSIREFHNSGTTSYAHSMIRARWMMERKHCNGKLFLKVMLLSTKEGEIELSWGGGRLKHKKRKSQAHSERQLTEGPSHAKHLRGRCYPFEK